MSTVQNAAAEAARRVVKFAWKDAGGGIPVDPAKIARRLGIDVFDAQLGERVAGALVKRVGEDPTILLNSADSVNRQRFTCAHEIGHFVKRGEQPDEFEFIDRRDQLAATGTDEDEIYANGFAAELLMPHEYVTKFAREHLSTLEMAARFGVSREAMGHRLENLGLADRVTAS